MTGKTVEDALQNALKELKLTEDKVEYEVLDEGHKGFLNIGSKPAKIRAKVRKDYISDAKTFLGSVLDNMGVKAEISIKEENNAVRISMSGPDMGILIGYRGET